MAFYCVLTSLKRRFFCVLIRFIFKQQKGIPETIESMSPNTTFSLDTNPVSLGFFPRVVNFEA